MVTLLARKSGPVDQGMATNDDHHDLMANDPSIPQIPAGSNFGSSYNYFGNQGMSTQYGSQSNNSFGTMMPQSGYNVNHQTPQNLTAAGSNAAQGADVLVANDNSDWINRKWRPVMGWVYMLTCTMDFVIFPILWSLLQALTKGNVTSQWQPLTLQGAGLYHIAMGAVLGIAAYGRTREKVAGAA